MRNVKRTIRASAKDVIADLAPPPQWIEPELCKLVTRIPAGDTRGSPDDLFKIVR